MECFLLFCFALNRLDILYFSIFPLTWIRLNAPDEMRRRNADVVHQRLKRNLKCGSNGVHLRPRAAGRGTCGGLNLVEFGLETLAEDFHFGLGEEAELVEVFFFFRRS
jgi:hypothetical protein